ncbi:MAG: pyruvate:ferredoxin (flavodoxin) oxidoreductase, partial [Elusimicrobiota bacterium]
MPNKGFIIDGNQSASDVAYRLSEVIAIYPITPASPMGEWADQWVNSKRPNLWGTVPAIAQLQSEAGVAGAIHGALTMGSIATTFTSSQGLLLMLPNMYKIAGELNPAVIHVAARSVATHALSIFGDHSDVMATRATGFAMLASRNVQEAADMAAIAHAATLQTRIPFLHFFDGFRTSHELAHVELPTDETLKRLLDPKALAENRKRGLNPEAPVIRGTAQNPDVFFQAREACNPFYDKCAATVQSVMDTYAKLTGRSYRNFEYSGAPDAERVIIVMGSGAQTTLEAVERLTAEGQKVGVLNVRLFRPFDAQAFLKALPKTVKTIAVLDRTKEPGSMGEPLFLDIAASVQAAAHFTQMPKVIGGRFGLSSKEFTPAMAKAVFDETSQKTPRTRFTVGINDDVSRLSLPWDPHWSTEAPETVRAIFFGLGADGTVGANKNSIKIIGEKTDLYAQAYFVYDSKKSGSMTQSHLRFGPKPLRASYLIDSANFIACHQPSFLERLDLLEAAQAGGMFLLNSPHPTDKVWATLPQTIKNRVIEKKLRFFVIDAYAIANSIGLGRRINTVMQAGFFALNDLLPHDKAAAAIKETIKKTYGSRGQAVIDKNCAAVDAGFNLIARVPVPKDAKPSQMGSALPIALPASAPDFVRKTLGPIMAGKGESLPVSAMPIDGAFPSDTAKWEKRAIAMEIPQWDEKLCIQCGKCVFVCPHAVIRAKRIKPETLENAPEGFLSAPAKWKDTPQERYTLQISAQDCTGCTLCVEVCPVKDKTQVKRKALNMTPMPADTAKDDASWGYFLDLPEVERARLDLGQIKDVQLLRPLFEFSGACAGCGETPYLKLLSQLYGDRAVIGNATGCSSIYGGNLPTTPWAKDAKGRGPAWSSSL